MESTHITQDQADEYAIGSLDPEAEPIVLYHMGICSECRSRVQAAERVAAALALGLRGHKPPRGLKQRILVNVGIARPHPLMRAFRWSRAVAGIAAVFVAVAAFTGMLSVRGQIHSLRDQNAHLSTQVEDALSTRVELVAQAQRLTDEENASQELRQTAKAFQDLTLAFLSPESSVADVISKEEAAGAQGRLVWDPDQSKLWFVARGLTPRKVGETYQIWVNSGGKWYSLGTFNSDASGFARYDTVLPQGLKTYESAVVTIERAGGAPERSGPSLFVADLSAIRK